MCACTCIFFFPEADFPSRDFDGRMNRKRIVFLSQAFLLPYLLVISLVLLYISVTIKSLSFLNSIYFS